MNDTYLESPERELAHLAIRLNACLNCMGIQSDVKTVVKHLKRVRAGVLHMDGHFTNWHKRVDFRDIDFRFFTERNAAGVFTRALNWTPDMKGLTDRFAQDCGLVLLDPDSQAEQVILTDEWRRQIARKNDLHFVSDYVEAEAA